MTLVRRAVTSAAAAVFVLVLIEKRKPTDQ